MYLPSRMYYIIIYFYKSKVLQTKPIHHQQIFISAHINRYVTLASLCPLNWTWMIANSSRLLLQKRKAYSGYKRFIETGRDQKIDQQKEAIYLSEDKWMSRDVVQLRQSCADNNRYISETVLRGSHRLQTAQPSAPAPLFFHLAFCF